MTQANFDTVARYYDFLATMIFGKAIVKAQTRFLSEIKPKSNILIVGGGTGWILEEIEKQCSACNITYLEASLRMIEITRKRVIKKNHATFLHASSATDPEMKFDVVITNFYLDLYDNNEIRKVINMLDNRLKKEGMWLVSDFQVNRSWPGIIWKKLMIWIMYLFFRVSTGLKTTKLPQIKLSLLEKKLTLLQEFSCWGGFIFSGVYKKG